MQILGDFHGFLNITFLEENCFFFAYLTAILITNAFCIYTSFIIKYIVYRR